MILLLSLFKSSTLRSVSGYHIDRGLWRFVLCELLKLELCVLWFHSMIPSLDGCGLEIGQKNLCQQHSLTSESFCG